MIQEATLHTTRPSRLISFKYYAAAVLLAILAFLLWFFQSYLPDLPIGRATLVTWVSAFLIFLAIVSVIIAELRRFSTKYIITDFRVIRKDGIVRRHQNVMPYTKLERVQLTQGLLDRILGIGTVVLDTGEDQIPLSAVRDPRGIEAMIMSRIQRTR